VTKTFEGKVALVTGTSSGIGRATAVAFAREGARVVLASRDEAGNAETLRLVRAAGGEGVFIRADMTRAADVEAMVRGAVEAFGRIDHAVNNAGVPGPARALFEHSEAEFDEIVAVNLKGVWLSMKHEIAQMLAQGGGAIVNVASVGGLLGAAGISVYAASKHGVVGLTRAAALELARANVRVNAVCPAVIRGTAMIDWLFQARPDVGQRLLDSLPMGRGGQPEEVAAAVLYLCSDGASFITGHALPVDGGTVAGR